MTREEFEQQLANCTDKTLFTFWDDMEAKFNSQSPEEVEEAIKYKECLRAATTIFVMSKGKYDMDDWECWSAEYLLGREVPIID